MANTYTNWRHAGGDNRNVKQKHLNSFVPPKAMRVGNTLTKIRLNGASFDVMDITLDMETAINLANQILAIYDKETTR